MAMHPKSRPAAPTLTLQLPAGGRDLRHAEVGGPDDIIVRQTVPATQPVMPSHRGPGGVCPWGLPLPTPLCQLSRPHPSEPPPRSPVGHPDPHLLTHGRELGKEGGRVVVSGGGVGLGGGGRSRHPRSPSPAASGAGSTAGWRSSPGSSSKAGGARRGMKSQRCPSACSSLTAALQQSRAAARHVHGAGKIQVPQNTGSIRWVARWGSASCGQTPSGQEAEDAMGCSGISPRPGPPETHSFPTVVAQNPVPSLCSPHPGHCPQGKIYGQRRLSALLRCCGSKDKWQFVGISLGEGTGGHPAAKGVGQGSAKPPKPPPHPGWSWRGGHLVV